MYASIVVLSAIIAQPSLLRDPSTVSDSYALESNPAALAFMRGSEFRVLSETSFSTHLANQTTLRGALIWPSTLALAASSSWLRESDGGVSLYNGVGSGLRLGQGALGVSWLDGPQGATWRLGYSLRPQRWFSASFVAAFPPVDGASEIYDIGLGFRPFASDFFTVASRWRYSSDQGILSDSELPDLETRLEFRPLDGLSLAATSDLNLNLFVELGIGFDVLSMSSGLRVDGDSSKEAWLIDVAISETEKSIGSGESTVIVAEVSGTLEEKKNESFLGRSSYRRALATILEDSVSSSEAAGLFLKIGQVESGWASAASLHTTLSRIKKSNKRIHCYLYDASDISYFIASACHKIWAPRSLLFAVDGLTAESSYFADSLSQAGIEVRVARAGEYKTAPEQFTRTGMSPEQKETVSQILDAIYGDLKQAISVGRGLEVATVEELIRKGTHTATQALQVGLVDQLIYADETQDALNKQYGRSMKFTKLEDIAPKSSDEWGSPERIAVINVNSQITSGASKRTPFGAVSGASTIIEAIEKARTDSSIRAVVLRIDSPGGDAFASDLIARSVSQLAKVKPVVASFADVAASGGYYIASPAKMIFAEPLTITGSIGAFSLDISLEKLSRSLGVNVEQVQRGSVSQRSSVLLQPKVEERKRAEKEISAIYEQFIQVVARGRKMKPSAVRKVAGGRVWTGRAAKARGLVDRLGGFNDAVQTAYEMSGIPQDRPFSLVTLTGQGRSFVELLRGNVMTDEEAVLEGILRVFSLNPWSRILKSGPTRRIMTQLPYDLRIR